MANKDSSSEVRMEKDALNEENYEQVASHVERCLERIKAAIKQEKNKQTLESLSVLLHGYMALKRVADTVNQ